MMLLDLKTDEELTHDARMVDTVLGRTGCPLPISRVTLVVICQHSSGSRASCMAVYLQQESVQLALSVS